MMPGPYYKDNIDVMIEIIIDQQIGRFLSRESAKLWKTPKICFSIIMNVAIRVYGNICT